MYNIGWLQRDSIINNYYPIIQNLITDLCFGLRLPEGCYEGRTLSKNDGATYICYKGYFRDCSEMVLRIDEERLRNEALLERNHIEIFLTFEHLPWIALPCLVHLNTQHCSHLLSPSISVLLKKCHHFRCRLPFMKCIGLFEIYTNMR